MPTVNAHHQDTCAVATGTIFGEVDNTFPSAPLHLGCFSQLGQSLFRNMWRGVPPFGRTSVGRNRLLHFVLNAAKLTTLLLCSGKGRLWERLCRKYGGTAGNRQNLLIKESHTHRCPTNEILKHLFTLGLTVCKTKSARNGGSVGELALDVKYDRKNYARAGRETK